MDTEDLGMSLCTTSKYLALALGTLLSLLGDHPAWQQALGLPSKHCSACRFLKRAIQSKAQAATLVPLWESEYPHPFSALASISVLVCVLLSGSHPQHVLHRHHLFS